MKKIVFWKRTMTLLLCLVMVLGLIPALPAAAAADTGGISTYLADFGFQGKTISILGDSISTFENYSSGTAADTTNSTIRDNAVYYRPSNVASYGVDVGDTWWQQTADVLGMRVLVNNSWSGSRVINFSGGTGSGYLTRCQQLHDDTGSNSGEKPDIIAIYLGTNDTKNADDPGDINSVDFTALKSVSSTYTPTTVFEAYALMVYRAQKMYPNAEIYCMTLIPYENITTAQKSVMLEFNEGVRKIAAHYGVYVADLYNESGLTAQSECFDYHMANRLHPGPYGMDAITNCLVNTMLENSQYNTSGQTLYPITYNLKDVFVKGGTIQNALKDKALTMGFGVRSGFQLDVSVTMDGVDITDCCYQDGVLTINQVTGPIVITGHAALHDKTPEIYRWELTSDHMLSVNDDGASYNGTTLIAGSCASSVFTDAQYSLEKPVILFHDRPWAVQWKSTGTFTGGMLMLSGSQNGKTEDNTYIFRRGGSSLMAIGYSDGTSYHNYGLDLSTHSIDATVSHTYRLVNQINADGSNMVYLYVDNQKLGAMNNYYLGTTNKNATSDWLNGKDLVFTQMGTDGHPINDGTINYIQVWENGIPADPEYKTFRWEPQNGVLTDITTDDLSPNPAQLLEGSISTDGKFSKSSFLFCEPIVLEHDRPWSVEWESSGTWKDSSNGALLLSASDTTNAVNGAYLYRRGGSDLIALGERANNLHNNYGISLADHGIDGSARHTYRLTNRVNGDGSNMVYLYVDGVELGAMNNYFEGGTATGTTNNWVNGRDFTFNYMGTPQFLMGNCYLYYLQIWENGMGAKNYRWENSGSKLESVISDEFTQNEANVLAGSISSGKLTDSRFLLNRTVTLRHDRPWSMEWKSNGTWKGSSNGALLLSTQETSTTDGTMYLYRRNGSAFIALGNRTGNKHHNYGITLSDHGIDGSLEHTYRLTNRLNADGSNMVYLSVDGVELGAMNQYYIGGTAQNTTDNWVSGKDFVFSYMGTTDFSIGNCDLEYLEIREEDTRSYDYRWETQNDVLTDITTDGFTANEAAIVKGSISSGSYTESQFKLERTARLLHNKAWSLEWQSSGSWANTSGGALLIATYPTSNTEGNTFLYRRKNSTLLGLGVYTGGKYQNYGITLSDHGIDGTASHVYRLSNHVNADGSNMVYLYVDDVELGPMNGYYLGGTYQDTTSNGLSGVDFVINYFGTEGHTLSSCDISYIQIREDTPAQGDYRWETQNDALTNVTTDGFTANDVQQLSGTITDGTYSSIQYKLDHTVSLRHDQPWAIGWSSQGNWKETHQGGMLLASHATHSSEGLAYLYRRSYSEIIALGVLEDGTHKNYGIRLADHGIDGTVQHEYLLANRVNPDGSNMVYLFVDGREVGPLNNYYKGGTDTYTKSDRLNGMDFNFRYLGTDSFYIGACKLDYLQIWEGQAPQATVTFQNWDGSTVETQTHLLGQKVKAPATNPTRPTDAVAEYTFKGWTPEIGACGGDQIYTAAYDADYRVYTVEFYNYDGTLLSKAPYYYGDAIITPADPVRPADETYTYTFTGWDGDVSQCSADAVYTAVFEAQYIDYTVQFLNDDGSVLSQNTYHYGDTPTAPEAPVKAGTAQYTYAFAGWDKEIAVVTADATYTAVYTSTVNAYTVTFYAEDGSVLSCQSISYGEMPSIPTAPVKESDRSFAYPFSGWDQTVTAVTGDAAYTAVYHPVAHEYTQVVTPPACTEGGYTTYTCASCGYSYTDDPTDPTGHIYQETVIPPTCTADGYSQYTCSCGQAYTDHVVAATGHSYTSVTTEPTCTTDGYTIHTCHCGDTYTDAITPALGHHYDAVVTEPTCTTDGYTVYTCTTCGDSYTDNVVPATGHSYEALTTVPTCTEGGYTIYTCACGDAYTDNVISAKGHDYKTTVTQPTCTEGGYTTYTCSACGYTYVGNRVSATGHGYQETVTAPNCSEGGYTDYTCITCGYSFRGNVTPAAGHSYEETLTAPTCTNGGYTHYVCTACGYDYKGNFTSATGHSYEAVVTAPNCTEAGYTTYTCACGDSYVSDETAPAGHSFHEGICTVCGETDPNYVKPSVQPNISLKYPTLVFEDVIMMNVYFSADQLQDVTEMGLITYQSEVSQWNVENAEAVIPGYTWSDADQLYYATTQGIAAKDLGDEIYFAVYARLADGTYYYTRLVSYSPRTYAYAQLATGSSEMKPLVVAMLNYGAAAQNYFSYKTDALVNSDLTDDQKALVDAYRTDMIAAVASADADKQGDLALTNGFAKRYPTVSFEGAFCINYYCTPSATPSDGITMYYWSEQDYDAHDVLTLDNATAAIPMTGEGKAEYNAAVEGIAAKDLDKGVYVCFVYTKGTNTYYSGILGYSIGTYCAAQANTTDTSSELAKATAVYGYYAKDLFYK